MRFSFRWYENGVNFSRLFEIGMRNQSKFPYIDFPIKQI